MNRSAMKMALVVAGLLLGTSVAAQKAPPAAKDKAVAAPVAVVQDEGPKQALAKKILEQIAAGRDASALIKQYRVAHGAGDSASVDRAAELRQLRDAEQALMAALTPLESRGGASSAELAPAMAAYQAWKAAAMLHTAHQGRIEKRLTESADGKTYLGRHQAVVKARAAKTAQIAAQLDAILGGAPGAAPTLPAANVKAALGLLKPARAVVAREPILNALSLPVGGLNLAARAPQLTPVLTPSYAKATETAALPADSAGAAEAPLADEIVKQSTALAGDYVRIYEFVRNKHRTEWYSGSVKGALGVLRSGAGNDVDQASLLVALLRASGVPTRYVRGVIELDLDKLAGDLGLKDSAQVPAALTRAGVAFSPVVRGGKVAAVHVEHVWVTALVPYTNYRGATVDASGKTWIPLDASFKDSTWSVATLTLGDVGSASALQTEYLAAPQRESFAAFVERKATEVLQRRDGAAASYAKAIGEQASVSMNLSVLPNSLPFPVVAVTAEDAALAPADIVQAHITLRDGANKVLDLTVPVHEIGNQRLTLSYQPATLEDHRLSLSFGGLDVVPLYLIQLRPQINVGGKARLLGSAGVTPGADLALDLELSGPFGTQRVAQSVMAGAYQAIHVGGAGATRPATPATSDGESYGANLLDGIAVAYSKSWGEGENQLAALNGVQLVRPAPAVAIVTNQMETEFLDDTPYTLVWKGVTLDAATHPVEAFGANAKTFMAMSGLHGSSLESVTFEKQFSVDAISADKGLALARKQGIALLNLNSGNIASLDAGDHLDPVKAHIRNLVRLGYKVEVPATRLAHEAWRGSVWRASDDATGASGYFISGGLAGGSTATAPNVWTLDFLRAALAWPNSEPFNIDPLSGVTVVKIGAADAQTGVVDGELPLPLKVAVFDKEGLPVKGAAVTFVYTMGEGTLEGQSGSYLAKTDERGIASAKVKLGKKTDVNAHYVVLPGSEPHPTRVSVNVIDVSVAAERPLVIDTPFTAIAKPDVLKGLKRTTTEDGFNGAGLWVDSLGMLLHDQFDNPVANVAVTFTIATTQVCQSDKSAQYFKQGAVFDNQLKDGAMVGCNKPTPGLGDCGAPSMNATSLTDGGVSAGVILGNDVKGINTVTVRAQGLSEQATYVAQGFCEQTGPYSKVNNHLTSSISGAVHDAAGANISAAKAGDKYKLPITSTLWHTKFPYEIRYENGKPHIYWHPFVKQERVEGTVDFSVGAGGSVAGKSKTGIGQYAASVNTGSTPALNPVTTVIAAQVQLPIIRNDAVSSYMADYNGPGAGQAIFGVRPAVERVISTGGVDPSRIMLDAEGRTKGLVTIEYKLAPADYAAASVEIDVFENDAYMTTISTTSKKDKGMAYIPRGMVFQSEKKYDAKVILNRGMPVQVDSEPFRLPTKQKLISYFNGATATLDVDLINQKTCDMPSSLEFAFKQPVLATMRMQEVDRDNQPLGQPIELFADKPFAIGDQTFLLEASRMKHGNFQVKLTAKGVADPSQTDEEMADAKIVFSQSDELPVGHVIVNGVKVRDGTLMAQTQSMSLPGRGPKMYFQPTYSSAGNGTPSNIGANWTHNFDSRVRINDCGVVSVSGGDGGGVKFFPDANGALKAGKGYHSEMKANSSDNSFDFYTKDGTKHHYKWFDRKAKWVLDTVTDSNGNRIVVEYEKFAPVPRIVGVSSSDGRAFSFQYAEEPLSFAVINAQRMMLKSVTGPGIAMSFAYDKLGNLIKASTNGREESFSYHVDGPLYTRHKMLSASDANGNVTEYVYNDTELNVMSHMMPHSHVTSVKTPTGSVKIDSDIPAMKSATVTDQNGHATAYTLNGYGSPLTIRDPIGTTTMTWDPADILMRSKMDARGVLTTFDYDSAGNLERETTAGMSKLRTYLIQSGPPFIKDRMTSQTDRNGNQRTYVVSAQGNVLEENLPEGVKIRHQYSTAGDVLSTTDGMGGVTKFTYDAAGNQESETDPMGNKTGTPRNSRGQVTALVDGRGNTTKLELDKHDQVISRTDPLGKKRSYTYDNNGNKLTETDENGNLTAWDYGAHDKPESIKRPGGTKNIQYDGVGNKIGETDYRGNPTTYGYDGGNRLVTRTEPLGKVTKYAHDGVGNVTSETDGLGGVTQHAYNALGYLVETTDAENGLWKMGRDNNGNKTSSTDPLSRVTNFSYDGLDRLRVQTAPLGATTTFVYDKNSKKISETDPLNHVSRHEFDAAGRIVKVIDAENKEIINSYDAANNLVKSIDANLGVTLFTYDPLNRKSDTTNPENYVTAYGYDGVGNLTSERFPNGNVVMYGYNGINLRTSSGDTLGSIGSWEFDADGNKTVEVDGNGNPTTHIYNALSQLIGSKLTEGRSLVFQPDVMGNNVSVTDARLAKTSFTYDKLNRLTKTVDALQGVYNVKYDAVGNKLETTDPVGGKTVTAYDALNRPVSVADAMQYVATFDYDLAGNKIKEVNKRQVASTYLYDKVDRLLSHTKDGLRLLANVYDANGNVLSTTDANGNTTSYVYDKRNLRIEEARLLGGITKFKLDSMGDIVVSTDPEQRVNTSTFDGRRRLKTQKNGAQEETAFGYDGAGNRVTVRRPGGAQTTFVFDAANRTSSIVDPVGTTKFGYDKNGNHTSVTDAENNTTSYVYDALNRRTSTAYPGGAGESFEFDGNGNITSQTDGNGTVVSHTFDKLNRETLTGFSASVDGLKSVSKTYDPNNNVTAVKQLGATQQNSTYSFDHFDREEVSTDPFGATSTKTYDANGNKTALITQDGKATRYTYDARNQLKSLTGPSGTVLYSYDRSGLNTKVVYGNGVSSTTTYDLARRVKTVVHAKGSDNLSRTEYAYDANSNRTRETINRSGGAQVTSYDYDVADRLRKTSVVEAAKTLTTEYGLDKVGNRVLETVTTASTPGGTVASTKKYTYDGRNQLTGIVDSIAGTTVLTYDLQGNLIQKALGSDLTAYRYNARDNLVSIARNGTTLGSYGNDYRGLRVEKEAKDKLFPNGPTVRVRTLWDGVTAFQDSDTSGAVVARYETDGRRPVSMWSRDDGVQALHRDALGSIVATTDSAGLLKSETIFDAYGNIKESTGASANKFGYTGHQMDHESGLIYFKARYYDPAIGRFITQDPFEGDWQTPMSLHHYLYAYSNPTVYVDLNGYKSVFGDATVQLDNFKQWLGSRNEKGGSRIAAITIGTAQAVTSLGQAITIPLDTAANLAQVATGVDDHQVREELAKTKAGIVKTADFVVNGNYAGAIKDAHSAAVDTASAAMGGDVTAIAKISEVAWGAAAGRSATKGGLPGKGVTPAPGHAPRVDAPEPPKKIAGESNGEITKEGKGKEVGGADAPNSDRTAAAKPSRMPCNCCFAAGTLVQTEEGFTAIEDLRVGDQVISKDEHTGAMASKPVKALIYTAGKTVYSLVVRNPDGSSESLTVTDNHPFWVLNKASTVTGASEAGWVDSAQLVPGMLVQNSDGNPVQVVSLQSQERIEETFNLTIADFNTYFVGNSKVWVHNDCTECSVGGPSGAEPNGASGNAPTTVTPLNPGTRFYVDSDGNILDARTYARNSGFRQGVRTKVWAAAVDKITGLVIDPLTKATMDLKKSWDMGHRPGMEYWKERDNAINKWLNDRIFTPRKKFLDRMNDPKRYQPELPESNRSHRGEDDSNELHD